VDFRFYLLAMSANYAFFIPDDEAFDQYYIDPTSLGHSRPEVLHFYFDATRNPSLRCERFYYNVADGSIGQRIGEVNDIKQRASQLIDILNYHTVLLGNGEKLGTNHYYQTKHGGTIYVENAKEGGYVASGGQIESDNVPKSKIESVHNQSNGDAFRIDHIIQAPQRSVSRVLRDYDQFTEFYEACSGFSADNILTWAGISADRNSFGTTEQDQYIVFTSTYGTGNNAVTNACLDENVKLFNTYNYTLYAPDNAAMEKAYANGLPRWTEIQELFDTYGDEASSEVRNKAKKMINAIRKFVRYHFQSISLYADNVVTGGEYQTLATDVLGLAKKIEISGGNGEITIKDEIGLSRTVNAKNNATVSNQMARDYWFNSSRTNATEITTSSFCAVHEITDPLYLYRDSSGKPTWDPSYVE
jgi:uncharacterized surface protein with fasciclin (FAS1) repeats